MVSSARSRFDLVIFDCDGVIVDSEAITHRVFGEMLRELGLQLSARDMVRELQGRSLDDCLAFAQQRLGRTIPRARIDEYRACRDAALRAEVKPIEGVPDLLASLQVPYCIASSGRRDKMDVTLGATGMAAMFEGRVFSADDVRNAKPAPDLFQLAALRMGAEPSRTAVVEDSVTGVRAGCAAGMTVFGYAAETAADRLIEAGANATFRHMSELQSLVAGAAPRSQR